MWRYGWSNEHSSTSTSFLPKLCSPPREGWPCWKRKNDLINITCISFIILVLLNNRLGVFQGRSSEESLPFAFRRLCFTAHPIDIGFKCCSTRPCFIQLPLPICVLLPLESLQPSAHNRGELGNHLHTIRSMTKTQTAAMSYVWPSHKTSPRNTKRVMDGQLKWRVANYVNYFISHSCLHEFQNYVFTLRLKRFYFQLQLTVSSCLNVVYIL